MVLSGPVRALRGATRRSRNHRTKAGPGRSKQDRYPDPFLMASDLLLKLPVHLTQTGRQAAESPVKAALEVSLPKHRALENGSWAGSKAKSHSQQGECCGWDTQEKNQILPSQWSIGILSL